MYLNDFILLLRDGGKFGSAALGIAGRADLLVQDGLQRFLMGEKIVFAATKK